MKLLAIFNKTLREQRRDLLLLVLSLIFAPVFVLLYRVWFPSGSTTYGVLILNQDAGIQTGDGATLNAGEQISEALKALTYANGSPLLDVRQVTDRGAAEPLLKDRQAALLLVVPPDLTASIEAVRRGQAVEASPVTLVGDLTNPYYAVAAVLASSVADQYIQAATGQERPIPFAEEPLGASAARTEFEVYVPGLLVFATMMMMFTVAMTVVREAESGALRRLQMACVSSLDLLGGISAAMVLLGVAAVVLTIATAWGLGFRSQGSMWLVVAVGAMTSVSIVGVGLIIASLSRTVTQAFLIANFPLALFMFFSSAVFPVPRVTLFTVAGRAIGLYDILPPTHAVVALNKVLTMGAGLGDVVYELTALLILSAVYFAAGVWLFSRTHLRAD
ncbi:MAG: ABC transporter permease [Anaerolineae bacterium]|nr:ABC transporter permease [Anaerolineae bacterium]